MSNPPCSPGLEGVIAGESSICSVDPDAGLLYRGYDIHELATRSTFEQIAYLLLNGELPDTPQRKALMHELAAQSALPEQVVSMLRLVPAEMHPIDLLRTGVSMLGSFDPDLNDNSHAANLRKSVRIIARVSTLVTSGWRIAHHAQPLEPGDDLDHAGRFLFCLTGKNPQPWQRAAFNTILILYAEHEFNASTFSARVTASTLADMYAAITAAVATLKGPLHGGANEQVMTMLQDIGVPERAESWVLQRLARHEKIMGFGHRVYKKGDSRVPAMRDLCEQLSQRLGGVPWVPICRELERVMEQQKSLFANLDLYAGPVFSLMGIPPELNTPIFAVSRVSGWCAHVIEQHDHNRLIRPRSLYTGPPRRS